MNTKNRKIYKAGPYNFVECELCGMRHNAGYGTNSTGRRYVIGHMEEWWAKHTGQKLEGWAESGIEAPKCQKI